MATITLTISDAQLARVRASLCATANLPDSNPNAKQAVINWAKEVVRAYEYNLALVALPPIVDPDTTGIIT